MPLRETVDRFWPTLVALVGTAAVVAGVLAVFGQQVDSVQGPLPGDAAATATATAPPPTPAPAAPPAETPAPAPEPAPEPAPPRAPVVVLNGAGVQGLGAQVQERLRGGGWEVVDVGDFRGNVAESTVYFPPDFEAAAQALAAQFPEIGRVRGNFEGLPADRLTVILRPDYVEETGG